MLYKEASKILLLVSEKKGSIKNLVFSSKYKNKKQLYALVCETLKYKSVLETILQATKIQKREKILRQQHLAVVLLYDFLIGRGFIGPTDIFKDAILKHKAALQSELARLKVNAKATRNEDLLSEKMKNEVVLPRYVRVNTIITCVDDVIEHFRRDRLNLVSTSQDYHSYMQTVKSLKKKQFLQDPHIPELLVCAPGTDLHNHVLYNNGSIILQDKASCLPAYILDPPPGSHVIDCCSAPGNKTSHLAAILGNKGRIFAFDKDIKRVTTMKTLLLKAGVLCADTQNKDFLQVDPRDAKYQNVKYILVDPSCSGSGIVNRLNDVTDDEGCSSESRLQNLAKFQVEILTHAMTFPAVVRVVYSTCSIHDTENEAVVREALRTLDDHFKLVTVMKEFPNRGQHSDATFKARRCLRMSPDSDMTNGFFVACLQRIKQSDIDLVKVRLGNLKERDVTSGNTNNDKGSVESKGRPSENLKNRKRKNPAEKVTTQPKKPKLSKQKGPQKQQNKRLKSGKNAKLPVQVTSPPAGQMSLQAVSNRSKGKKKRSKHKKHKPITE